MKIKTLAISIFVLVNGFLIASCASTGNQALATQEKATNINSQIINNKTTKAQMKALLGEANNISFYENGNEYWTYYYKKSEPKVSNFIPVVNVVAQGTNDTKRKLVIVFNKKGIVIRHAFSQSKGETKMGLVS